MAEASWGHSKAKKATRLPPADMEPVRSIPEKGPGTVPRRQLLLATSHQGELEARVPFALMGPKTHTTRDH